MKKGLFDVKVFMITLCFIVREQGSMERQVIDLFASFGLIIGVAHLHPFLCCAVITPEMTILDIISQHRETEMVFKRLEEETGTCVCCQGLFLTLREAAKRFGFDLENALAALNAAIDGRIR